MRAPSLLRFAAVCGLIATAACAETPVSATLDGPSFSVGTTEARTFIVLGVGNRIPAGLANRVAAAGGHISATTPEIGMALVSMTRADAEEVLAGVPGVSDVMADRVVQWQDPSPSVEMVEMSEGAVATAAVGATGVGDNESFRAVQWAPDAVSAPAAWNAGYRGAGARVAILDGGVHSTHLDLVGNLDVSASRSFVPGQTFNADVGTFWHGTHVAGIVGAAAQGLGTVGIAPEATLIAVKVLHNGSGAFSWVINGMVYAATPVSAGGAGAHILNLSLGAGFFRQGKDAAQLSNLVSRAAMYARQQGALVIAAAGNDAIDLDHTGNLIFIPAQSTGVVAVSSTGPMGWAVPGTAFNLDRPASYTNFGRSAITLAAPGGDFALPRTAVCSRPRLPSGAVTAPCWVFDMVMAPCRGAPASVGTFCFAAGTSMAAPAAAGVAALIVGKYGPMSPAQLEIHLRNSADSPGQPGNDPYYGRGRVNAQRAVE